ncbi:CBS domain-containing protein, partial [Streptomyces albogriseolus]|uniref:CBS domain-containing protein n=1 Tax=Streptomyces albogriseolus TaxID=1887 RepID=UPI003461431B
MTTRVRDVMSAHITSVEPMTSVTRAAWLMREQNVGDVLVAYDCDLFGVLTDRDIVLRGAAEGAGLHPDAPPRERHDLAAAG